MKHKDLQFRIKRYLLKFFYFKYSILYLFTKKQFMTLTFLIIKLIKFKLFFIFLILMFFNLFQVFSFLNGKYF